MEQHRPGFWTRGRLVTALAIVGAVGTLTLRWPGTLPIDALNQLQQARSGIYLDGNPPLMAALWRVIGLVPQSMLVLQICLFWLGLGLIASNVRGKWAFAILALGVSPLAVYYNGIVQKDSVLAAAFLCAVGLMSRQLRPFAIGAALFGAMIRANGGFAIAPLIFKRHRLLWTLPVALFMIVAVSLSSRHVFEAEREGLERALQLYDTAGIAFYSKDHSALPVEISDLERCYTPFFWDTLGEDRCDRAYTRLPNSITGAWLGAITSHPIAYLQHRLAHYNRATFFLVPPAQQCESAPEMHACDGSEGWRDLLIKNAYFWPGVWLAVGLALLLASNIGPTASSLCLSGLLYGGAYLVIGVASDFRYFYWTELSVQVAVVIALSKGVSLRWPLVSGVSVAFVGYAARIAYLL